MGIIRKMIVEIPSRDGQGILVKRRREEYATTVRVFRTLRHAVEGPLAVMVAVAVPGEETTGVATPMARTVPNVPQRLLRVRPVRAVPRPRHLPPGVLDPRLSPEAEARAAARPRPVSPETPPPINRGAVAGVVPMDRPATVGLLGLVAEATRLVVPLVALRVTLGAEGGEPHVGHPRRLLGEVVALRVPVRGRGPHGAAA